MPSERRLTEDDARDALRGHVQEKALAARERYGAKIGGVGAGGMGIDRATLGSLLNDPEVARWPTELVFDADSLRAGEFGFAAPVAGSPEGAWQITLHPRYSTDDRAVVLLAAYHIVSINYGEIATHEEAEEFGATLLGIPREEYYAEVCALADRE